MTTVYLKDDNIRVKVPLGMNLREVAMKTGASMEFGCRIGDCGSCNARVDKGIELLNPLTKKEITVFKMFDQKNNNQRLMCQCIVDSQEGEIIISYIKIW
ncbi:2Fe-2S iron-sulfur cluster-binding protein [Sulfurovum sp. zt1-1]|uniref:2Fe-2S iron-sulfur cluster-binding protein n=1 Tax=Sulfurovum zhangzhouensis TaxID=3019067 RepID=A0ABT7QVE3_9BACT|nr:2Fe-2S iron-sulfur cluster-binding protein [Sulfurovum zhangzhouensis]MDM5270815.1 2Fe-2S iron-sulfur cluster-binding protein [Sulfurovum zhangzhouensis]